MLIRDFGIGADVETATQARLVRGQCKSRLAIISFCDLTIDQNPAGATQRTELNYLFVDFSFSDYSVRLLSPKGDKSTITTDIGQEKLWNRAITPRCPVRLLPGHGHRAAVHEGRGAGARRTQRLDVAGSQASQPARADDCA